MESYILLPIEDAPPIRHNSLGGERWEMSKIGGVQGTEEGRAGNEADRILVPDRANPLNIRPGSAELLFLQMIRGAVHDHVIGHHRRARSKTTLAGELVRLPGVGPKTAKLLWDNFNSLQEMAAAFEAELAALPGIGKNKAARLHQELQKFR